MEKKIKKLMKFSAVGFFFMALFFNMQIRLTDSFIYLSGEVIAQTSSSSSSSGGYSCFAEVVCSDGGKVKCTGVEDCSRFSAWSVTCDGRTTTC